MLLIDDWFSIKYTFILVKHNCHLEWVSGKTKNITQSNLDWCTMFWSGFYEIVLFILEFVDVGGIFFSTSISNLFNIWNLLFVITPSAEFCRNMNKSQFHYTSEQLLLSERIYLFDMSESGVPSNCAKCSSIWLMAYYLTNFRPTMSSGFILWSVILCLVHCTEGVNIFVWRGNLFCWADFSKIWFDVFENSVTIFVIRV